MKSRTFGLELEHVSRIDHASLAKLLTDNGIPIDSYATGNTVCPEGCYSGWQVKTDGSITTEGEYEYQIELATPPMTFKQMPELRRALSIAREYGGINASCGLHVHVHAPEFARYRNSVVATDTLRHSWAAVEAVLFTYVPPSRRNNDYAHAGFVSGNKYQAFNVSSVERHASQTIEFRLHSATLNPMKAISFAALCVAFVNYMVKLVPPEYPTKVDPELVLPVEPKLIKTRSGTEFYLIRDKKLWHVESAKVSRNGMPDLRTAYSELQKPLDIRARSYLSAFHYPHFGNAMTELCRLLNVNGVFRGYLEDRYDLMLRKHGPAAPGERGGVAEDEDDYYNEPELPERDMPQYNVVPMPEAVDEEPEFDDTTDEDAEDDEGSRERQPF